MQGTRPCLAKAVRSNGIIPAYAGNTWGSSRCRQSPGDHPRVCGEHLGSSATSKNEKGSSPRMRGTRHHHQFITPEERIIPAYAGNTNEIRSGRPYGRDHPRVCGEHNGQNVGTISVVGSSPRMRGTLNGKFDPQSGSGIIPAYAGNTQRRKRYRTGSWDHPRVCGEHEEQLPTELMEQGSSPRMRGTRYALLPLPNARGIIPAYAGNTHQLRRFYPQ